MPPLFQAFAIYAVYVITQIFADSHLKYSLQNCFFTFHNKIFVDTLPVCLFEADTSGTCSQLMTSMERWNDTNELLRSF